MKVSTAAEGNPRASTERRHAELIREGSSSLRQQVDFTGFLRARDEHPELTFREHLRSVGGEIEV